MKRNKKQQAMIRAIAIILAVGLVIMSLGYLMYAFAEPAYAEEIPWGEEVSDEERLAALKGVIDNVRLNYKDEIDLDTLYIGIYQGLFDALGDPWSAFYTFDINDMMFSTTVEETFVGIGVSFRKTDAGEFLVVATIPGGAAEEAGIRTSDVIMKVDNTELTPDMSAEEVQELVRGELGSYVTITIDRFGETLVYTLQRRSITSRKVDSELLDGKIGYIKFDEFSEGIASEFATERLRMLNSGASSLIIDLRGNPGGYLSEVIAICNQLIPDSGLVIGSFVNQGEVAEVFYSEGSLTRPVPVVLLTDGESASASEFMAACLQQNGVATVIGEQTYGKGTVQAVEYAGDGMTYKLSCFYYLDPNGEKLDGAGVIPDIYVKGSGELSSREIEAVKSVLAPMTESRKYRAGEVGLNVYAAQQRLQKLGYDVPLNAVMDERTVAAVKAFQRAVGGYPYACLDYNTMRNLENAFENWLSGGAEDYPLQRAIEYLKGVKATEDAA